MPNCIYKYIYKYYIHLCPHMGSVQYNMTTSITWYIFLEHIWLIEWNNTVCIMHICCVLTQIAVIRWSIVGILLAVLLAQRWQMTLAQPHFAHWSNWNLLAQCWSNILSPTSHAHKFQYFGILKFVF